MFITYMFNILANVHAFVPTRSNNELIKEQDSLTSLKSYGNKQELEDDNDSCIGLEGNLLLKHNVAPFYCNVRRPYVQDKGRFNRLKYIKIRSLRVEKFTSFQKVVGLT